MISLGYLGLLESLSRLQTRHIINTVRKKNQIEMFFPKSNLPK